jgi:hypothetical protein
MVYMLVELNESGRRKFRLATVMILPGSSKAMQDQSFRLGHEVCDTGMPTSRVLDRRDLLPQGLPE